MTMMDRDEFERLISQIAASDSALESHRNALKSAAANARAGGSHPEGGNDDRTDGDRYAIIGVQQTPRER